jgi:hypothetical protein
MTPMTDDERFERLVRSAIPPVAAARPSRDLWPAIVNRGWAPARWSWLDLGVAAAVAVSLVMFPDALWLLAYHL